MDACKEGDVILSIPIYMVVLMDYTAINNSRNHRNHSSAMVTENTVKQKFLRKLLDQE
jgi:hypothetical protein